MTSAVIGLASETPEICYRAFPELLFSKACRKESVVTMVQARQKGMSCRICSHRRRTIALCAEQSLRFRCLSGADRSERGRSDGRTQNKGRTFASVVLSLEHHRP